MVDDGKTGVNGSCEELVADDEGERSVASVEDQLRKEMTVYEVYIHANCISFDLFTKGFCIVLCIPRSEERRLTPIPTSSLKIAS